METKKKPREKQKNIQRIENNSSIAKINHETLTDNKNHDSNKKKIINNIDETQKESKKNLKSKEKKNQQEQLEQSQQKKLKINNLKESINSTKNEMQKEITDKFINKKSTSKRKVNDQNHNESNVKHFKKAKLKEKIMKKKFNEKKKKNLKNKEINNDIASLNPERLRMYGINPKKLKNKLKYGKKKQQL